MKTERGGGDFLGAPRPPPHPLPKSPGAILPGVTQKIKIWKKNLGPKPGKKKKNKMENKPPGPNGKKENYFFKCFPHQTTEPWVFGVFFFF